MNTATTFDLSALLPVFSPATSPFATEPLVSSKDVSMTEQEQSRREDEELVARSQSGDAAAFDALIVKHSPRLYGLVYHMTANHDDTDDLLQDVWAKAYRSIGGFRGKSQFYTWTHSIAANTTINFLKKRQRQRLHRAHRRQHARARYRSRRAANQTE
jgi:DNA-directed RNA polymerase specialized sigma24 family protein